jgi:hypothetical protein
MNSTVDLLYLGVDGGVMRKNQRSLTYRGDKVRKRYQDQKKNFWGTEILRDLFDEVSYTVSCLRETLNIVGLNVMKQWSHTLKKFSQGKK